MIGSRDRVSRHKYIFFRSADGFFTASLQHALDLCAADPPVCGGAAHQFQLDVVGFVPLQGGKAHEVPSDRCAVPDR